MVEADSKSETIDRVTVMKKLYTKPLSIREETFALAFCICACGCSCGSVTCRCPIAPTHQEGINAIEANDTSLRQEIKNNTDAYTELVDVGSIGI